MRAGERRGCGATPAHAALLLLRHTSAALATPLSAPGAGSGGVVAPRAVAGGRHLPHPRAPRRSRGSGASARRRLGGHPRGGELDDGGGHIFFLPPALLGPSSALLCPLCLSSSLCFRLRFSLSCFFSCRCVTRQPGDTARRPPTRPLGCPHTRGTRGSRGGAHHPLWHRGGAPPTASFPPPASPGPPPPPSPLLAIGTRGVSSRPALTSTHSRRLLPAAAPPTFTTLSLAFSLFNPRHTRSPNGCHRGGAPPHHVDAVAAAAAAPSSTRVGARGGAVAAGVVGGSRRLGARLCF